MKHVCHKQKVVRFHRSDSNSPISGLKKSPWRGPFVQVGDNSAGLWVFSPWLIHATHKDAHRTTHPRLKHTLWNYANVWTVLMHVILQVCKQRRYKHTQNISFWAMAAAVGSQGSDWQPREGGNITSPDAPWGISPSAKGLPLKIHTRLTHKHTSLFQKAVFIPSSTLATVLCQLG